MEGYLEYVTPTPLGSTVAVAAAAAATAVTVDWSADYNEAGCTIELNGQTLDVASAVYADDNETVLLSFEAGQDLDGATVVGDFVQLLNADGEPAQRYTASVVVQGTSVPEEAEIPVGLMDKFVPGDSQAGALVSIEDDGAGGYVVTGQPGQTPQAIATSPPTTILTVKAAGDAGGITAMAIPDGPIPASTTFNWYLDGELIETTQSLVYRFSKSLLGLLDETDYSITAQATNDIDDGIMSAPNTARLNEGVSEEVIVGILAAGTVISGVFQAGLMTWSAPTTADPKGGLRIPLPNGGLIHLPANGSDAVFLGVVLNALRLVVETFTLTGTGTINPGAALIMASGVVAPSEPPRADLTWDDNDIGSMYTYFDEGLVAGTPRGMYDDGTKWWFTLTRPDGAGWIYSMVKSGGIFGANTIEYSGINWSGGAGVLCGLTKVGASWYVMYRLNTGAVWVTKCDSSWAVQAEFQATALNGDNLGNFPTIASDGTDLFIARMAGPPLGSPADPNRLIVRQYTTAGVQVGTADVTDLPGVPVLTLRGLYVGSADFGAARYVAASTDRIIVTNQSTAGTRQTAQEWERSQGDYIFGLSWDGTRFHTLADDRVWHYGQTVTATTRSIKETLYDSVSGLETDAGPALSYVQPPRTYTRVDVDPLPASPGTNEPDRPRIYIGNHRQAELAAGESSAIYDVPGTAGAASPGSNGFAGVSSPGIGLQSTAADADGPLLAADGTGRARLGDLAVEAGTGRVNADRQVGSASTATTSGNITAESFRLASAFTGRTNQRYAIRVTVNLRNNTANGRSTVRIKWDTSGTGTSGTTILTAQVSHPATTSIVTTHEFTGEFVYTGADLASLFGKLTVEATNGTTVADAANFGPTRVSVHAIATP